MAGPLGGEPDVAHAAGIFADPRRVRVLMALADGRALPAGRLAEEAGVAASTVSNHLGLLLREGLVDELLVYLAPKLIGEGMGLADRPFAAGPLARLADALPLVFRSADMIGPDLRIVARVAGRDAF